MQSDISTASKSRERIYPRHTRHWYICRAIHMDSHPRWCSSPCFCKYHRHRGWGPSHTWSSEWRGGRDCLHNSNWRRCRRSRHVCTLPLGYQDQRRDRERERSTSHDSTPERWHRNHLCRGRVCAVGISLLHRTLPMSHRLHSYSGSTPTWDKRGGKHTNPWGQVRGVSVSQIVEVLTGSK